MKTYVTIDKLDKRYDSIDDAIQAAEDMELETVTVYVHDEDGNILDSQECDRNPYSNDLVYCTWGVFAYRHNGYCDKMLAEGINSEAEAREAAEKCKNDFWKYEEVRIETYEQTLSENIGDVGESIIIYGEKYAIITEPNVEISKQSIATAKKERPYDDFTDQLISAHIMNGVRNGTFTIEEECASLEEAKDKLKYYKCSYGKLSGFAGVPFYIASFTYIEKYVYDEDAEEYIPDGEYDFAEFEEEKS